MTKQTNRSKPTYALGTLVQFTREGEPTTFGEIEALTYSRNGVFYTVHGAAVYPKEITTAYKPFGPKSRVRATASKPAPATKATTGKATKAVATKKKKVAVEF